MINNDVFRRLRYALDLDDPAVVGLFALAGVTVTEDEARSYTLRQDEEEHLPLDDATFQAFLDALIRDRRGPPPPGRTPPPPGPMSNNEVLKKLRIALSLQSDDIRELVRIGGKELGKAELGGLLRPADHRHFRPCGDQLLRAFFRGLTAKLRG